MVKSVWRSRAALSAMAAGMALGGGDCAGPPGAATTVPSRPPRVVRVPVPDTPGSNAIYGAIGTDRNGHIWLGVSSKHTETPSAHLYQYDCKSGQVRSVRDNAGNCYVAGGEDGAAMVLEIRP